MSIQSLTQEVEEIARELHGPKTEVSVDYANLDDERWYVRLWDAKGAVIDSTEEPLTKEKALREMIRRLTT